MILYYLLLAFVLLLLGLLWVFLKKEAQIKKKHRAHTKGLQLDIALHQTQIHFRQTGLNSYDFLLYNLGEALVVQPQIKIQ
jgi:hypothetical protein